GILEIKSINSNGFVKLKSAREDHQQQAMVYLYCSEERRLYLKSKYPTLQAFLDDEGSRREYYEDRYKHLKDGSTYNREEKIRFQVNSCLQADFILFNTTKPVDKVVFLYENKDNQELKEFTVKRNKDLVKDAIDKYKMLNDCCVSNTLPNREGTSKSCQTCRYCNYKTECWV
ncbi:MAG: hypothetical protein R3Y64_11020, partial [Peptostreptococcaceae bacterium]